MSVRRLENDDEGKFWEAWIKDDLVYCWKFGKIGSSGHTKIKKFKTRADAEAELEARLEEKLGEGYVEPGAEEDEAVEEADEAVEDEAAAEEDDDDDTDSDDDDDTDSDDDDTDSDDAVAPAAVAASAPEPARLPPRFTPVPSTPKGIDAAAKAIEALGASVGSRSWHVAQRARKARKALERIAGIDPADATLSRAFDPVMALVLAPNKRLPLEHALGLLSEVDAAGYARVVSRWRAKVLASPATTAITILAATFDALEDKELAAQAGSLLVDRRLPAAAWSRRFAQLKPFLADALARKGSNLPAFLDGLRADDDPKVGARVAAAKGGGSR
jgi:predicted DNA-binding WGR domain protein